MLRDGEGNGDGETELELLILLGRLEKEVAELTDADPRPEDVTDDVGNGDGEIEDVLLLGIVVVELRELGKTEELEIKLLVGDGTVEVRTVLVGEVVALLVDDWTLEAKIELVGEEIPLLVGG